MSLIALVRCGRTSGSDSIERQLIGPFLRYCLRNRSTASLLCASSSTSSSMRITVSGESNPWAVGKEGSVSPSANTEFESSVEYLRFLFSDFFCSPTRITGAILSGLGIIFCATFGLWLDGWWGTYMLITDGCLLLLVATELLKGSLLPPNPWHCRNSLTKRRKHAHASIRWDWQTIAPMYIL